MLRTLYLESVSGASGDMLLGALCGLGLDFDSFKAPLERGLPELEILRERVSQHAISAWRVWGEVSGKPAARHLSEILSLIDGLEVNDRARERAKKAFERLAEVEARAHDCALEEIHFHELGATDSIMDIVGFFWALELLDVQQVVASPLKLGHGFVDTDHGVLPVPVPAVAALVEGLPVEVGSIEGEQTTPTGALLIGEVASSFGPLPDMGVIAQAMGAGSRVCRGLNVHRAWLGEARDHSGTKERLQMLEFNVDDMSPEQLAYLRERVEAHGVADFTILTGEGKKGRPIHLIQILLDERLSLEVIKEVFLHSSTLGLRRRSVERIVLPRKEQRIECFGSSIRVKEANFSMGSVARQKFKAEYEDCAALSRSKGISLLDVYDEVRRIIRRDLQED